MLLIREVMSLVAALMVLAMGIYFTYYGNGEDGWIFFGLSAILLLFYILRRRMRLKFEEQEKNS